MPLIDPSPGLKPEKYIDSSLFPVPYQAVIILKEAPLKDLISWNLSTSSKAVKVKLEWSCDPNPHSNFKLQEKLPINLIKALCLYELTRPSWSMTSSTTKISCNFEWSLSSFTSDKSSNILTTSNQNISLVSSNSPKTPFQRETTKYFDSGYLSNKSTVGCYDSNIQNWRSNSSSILQPKFSPSPPKKNHDVFIPSKASSKSSKKSSTSKSNMNSMNSKSPELINSISALATSKTSTNCHTPKALKSQASNSCGNLQQKTASSKSSTNDEILDPKFDGYRRNPAPSSVPVDENGFIPECFDIDDYNITGRCRLCQKKVSSVLIDLHLTTCPKISDRDQLLSSFLDETSQCFRFKRETIKDLMPKYYKTQLADDNIPNEHFKDSFTYSAFCSELDNIADLLSEKALGLLNIVRQDKYNILDYRKDNDTHFYKDTY